MHACQALSTRSPPRCVLFLNCSDAPRAGRVKTSGHELPISCQPPAASAGTAPAISSAGQTALPDLMLRLTIGPCPPGTSVDATTGSQCLPCEAGTFNFDGLACRACPFGALAALLETNVCGCATKLRVVRPHGRTL